MENITITPTTNNSNNINENSNSSNNSNIDEINNKNSNNAPESLDCHLETEDYSFTDELRIPKLNSFRGIFVSCWDHIEPFEVYISKDQQISSQQIAKLLQVPSSRREYIGNNDSSFFYFALFTISNPISGGPIPEGSIKYEKLQSLPLNLRANQLKKKKKLKGDAVFINAGLDGMERDISLDQYKKVLDNLVPRQKVFDFEGNLIAKSDIVSTILYKKDSQFQLEEEDNFHKIKKNPTAIINEYKVVVSSEDANIFTNSFGGYSKPFYSTCTVNDHTMYSKVFTTKADSIRSCQFRALRYLETLQSVKLGHSNIGDKEIQAILNETYYSEKIDQQIRVLENDTNYIKNIKAEAAVASSKDIILDVLEKSLIELGDSFDNDQIFGVQIKKDHKVLTTQNGKIEIHYIKEVDGGGDSSSNNNNNNPTKPTLGEQVKLDFIYYLPDGKVLDRRVGNFTYGLDESIIDGLHYVIAQMNFNEIALALIGPDFAYGEQGIGAIDQYLVPPNSTIGVLVELSQTKRLKPTPEQLVLMPIQIKINCIKRNNELAKQSFKEGLFLKAFRYYKVSKGYCNKKYLGKCESDELFYEFQELAAQTLTNICICYEKMPNNEKITTQDKLLDRKLKYCTYSLDYSETSKAYRLRSGYYKELKQYQQSLDDLIAAKEIDQATSSFGALSESQYDKQIQILSKLNESYKKNESIAFQNHFNSNN